MNDSNLPARKGKKYGEQKGKFKLKLKKKNIFLYY